MLSELRRSIDNIDEELMRLIGERIRLAARLVGLRGVLGYPSLIRTGRARLLPSGLRD
ncbi:hypothetical protein [Vulcanisaeta sp. JCM 16159]|uniref:hypothetical protein n=1 Tax=Vulcanisaeta sp. JCM 16159 TaxID=1295371 RepID=UPI000B12C57A